MTDIKITSVLVNPEALEKVYMKPLLIKMMVGDRYLFWKVLKISTAIKITGQIEKELRLPDKKSFFYNLTNWIRKSKIYEIRIEVISGYDNKAQLLIDEYNLISENKSDKKLLSNEPNIKFYPRWIPQDDINVFKKYYTTGKNTGSSNKDKNLRRFLNTMELAPDQVDKIYNYMKTRYK